MTVQTFSPGFPIHPLESTYVDGYIRCPSLASRRGYPLAKGAKSPPSYDTRCPPCTTPLGRKAFHVQKLCVSQNRHFTMRLLLEARRCDEPPAPLLLPRFFYRASQDRQREGQVSADSYSSSHPSVLGGLSVVRDASSKTSSGGTPDVSELSINMTAWRLDGDLGNE